MHAGRHYGLKEILTWTRREMFIFVCLGSVPPLAAAVGADVGVLPWPPLAVLGTAVAFMTGFKSNAAYGRLWEARQIWGGIVNTSRAWGMHVRDFIDDAPDGGTHRRLVLRHIAWLTALRHQLRELRAWETSNLVYNSEYRTRTFSIPEQETALDGALKDFLSNEDLSLALAKKNRASALLALQSADLKLIYDAGRISEYRHVELMRLLSTLLEHQGKSERIKNFPYPRQFATFNLVFTWLFIILLPFGVATELKRMEPSWVWLALPVTVLVAWVFHTMDKIGEASENPFEGGPNDVPITAMSRSIEIDLLDFMGDHDLPKPCVPVRNILM